MSFSHEIRSLLRPRRRLGLNPPFARAPIPEAIGISEWHRDGDGVSFTPWVLDLLRLEPGALCFSAPIAFLEFPMPPVRPGWLANWLSGAGVPIPGGEGSTLVAGELIASRDVPPVLAWTMPYVDGLVYSTLAKLGPLLDGAALPTLKYPAHRYTGGGRAYQEALLAAGFDIEDRLPQYCSHLPGIFSVMWQPAAGGNLRRPWAVNISTDGLSMWRMAVSDRTQPIFEWVESGAWTGHAAHLGMLFVLADLAPVGDQVVVLASDDMGIIYDDTDTETEFSETTILDDALPAGASAQNSGDTWTWVTSGVPIHSGTAVHKSTGTANSVNIHGFYRASGFGELHGNQAIGTWVYLPETGDIPTALLLRVFTDRGTYNAYLGDPTGLGYDPKLRCNEYTTLPPRGEWFYWFVPVSGWATAGPMGLIGAVLRGAQFGVRGPTANVCYWDRLAVTTGWATPPNGALASWQGGWMFCPVSPRASLVNVYDYSGGLGPYCRTAVAEITVEWVDDEPTATFVFGGYSNWRPHPAYRSIWVEDANIPGQWHKVCPQLLYGGPMGSGPIWVAYSKTGERYVAVYKADFYVVNGTESVSGSLSSCPGGGGDMTTISGNLGTLSGGVEIGAFKLAKIRIGNGTMSTSRWSSTPGQYPSTVSATTASGSWTAFVSEWNMTAAGGCGDVTLTPEQFAYEGDPEPGVIVAGAQQVRPCDITAESVSESYTAGNGFQFLAISPRHPDALWALNQTTNSGHTERILTYETSARYSVKGCWAESRDQGGTWTPFADVGVEAFKTLTFYLAGAKLVNDTGIVTKPTTEREGIALCCGAAWSGDPGADAWSVFDSIGTEPVGATLVGKRSAKGSIALIPYPGADWESDELDTADCAELQSWVGG